MNAAAKPWPRPGTRPDTNCDTITPFCEFVEVFPKSFRDNVHERIDS